MLVTGALAAASSAQGGSAPARYEAVDLGTLGGNASVALAINAAGVVAGTSRLPGNDRTHAFVWAHGTMRDLGSLPGLPDSAASAIDGSGVVTGRAWAEGPAGVEGPARAFRSTRRGLVRLSGAAARRVLLPRTGSRLGVGIHGATDGEARARNRVGQVVGDFYLQAAGDRHAFLRERGTTVDLNALLSGGSGWVLQQATAINDAGEIVGVGTHDGLTRAFLLEPAGRVGAEARAAAVPARAAPTRPAEHVRVPAAVARRSLRAALAGDPVIQVVRENPSVETEAVDADGNAYGLAVGGSGTDLLRSSDEGATWSFVHSFPSGSTLWHIAALASGTLLAAVDTGSWTIWRSADHGITWTKVLTLPTAPVYYRTLTPHSIADGAGYVWLGSYNNGSGDVTNYLYRSADDGRTWGIASTSTTHKHIHGVRYDDANGTLYVLFGDSTGDGIWQSTDDGVTLAPLCTTYACIAIDMAFDPGGTFGVFGQDHYNSTRSIVRIDLATGALTTLAALPYSSFAAERVGGTYLVGTTRETGEATTDPNLHVFASNDGSRFVDAYQKPVAYTSGIENLRVQFAFPNGDFPIQVGGYGTIVARIASSSSAPPASLTPPTISGPARVGSTLTASAGTWANGPTSFAYRWQRCDIGGASCGDLAGATAVTYVPVSDDVGHGLRVVVTATNAAGSGSAPSDATAAVTSASATAVLVVVAHPDDEALGFAGVIESAVAQGRPVYVAVVTNGDAGASGSDSGWCGAASGAPAAAAHLGIVRDGETLSGMSLLGLERTTSLATTQIVFLGYPNGALQTIAASSSPWTGDATGLHRTYADDGDTSASTCNGDLHYLATGAHAALDAGDLGGDFDRLLALTHPADVYTHSADDGHSDHATVHRLVLDAIARAGTSPVVHTTLIHPEGTDGCMALSSYLWPNPADATETDPYSRFTPTLDVTAPPTPPCSSTPTGSSWGSAGAPDELVPVPADMRSTDPAANRKWQVISRYASQISCTPRTDGTYPASCGYMRAFAKADEFFWTEQPVPTGAPVDTTLPAISGTAQAGSTLTASPGTWSGAPTSYAYEWRRCDTAGGGCTAIAGATAATYLLGSDDVGHTLRVAVTATNAAGSTTAVGDPTATVAAAPGGETRVGQPVVGTLVDGGGANYLDVSGPYTVSSPLTITGLEGYMAGGSSPSRVRAVVYQDGGGQPGTVVAVSTEVTIAAGAAAAWVPLPLASPTTVGAGSYWLGYWYADGYGRRYYVAAAGAERYRGAAYSATGAPPSSFGTASSSSSAYSLVAVGTAATGSPPVDTAPPTIGGSAVEGQALTATTGTWSGSPSSYAYAWQRCDSSGNGCAAIAGATASSYTLVAADVGTTIRVAVTASNGAGSATATSAATAVVTTAPSVPANTALPTISGSAVEGQALTATTGTWSGSPSSYAYAWQRCDSSGNGCAAIAGATASSYTLVAADVGTTIRVAVTASNDAGSATATSAATGVVTAATPGTGSLGEATAGSLVDRGAAGYLDVSGPYQLAVGGAVSQLLAYLAGGTAASSVRAVIYADSGGQPGALVAVSAELATAAAAPAGWTALTLTAPVSLSPGSYWLGYWYADGNGRHFYVDRAGSERYRTAPYSATASPPATFGAASSSSSAYSLTAPYTTP